VIRLCDAAVARRSSCSSTGFPEPAGANVPSSGDPMFPGSPFWPPGSRPLYTQLPPWCTRWCRGDRVAAARFHATIHPGTRRGRPARVRPCPRCRSRRGWGARLRPAVCAMGRRLSREPAGALARQRDRRLQPRVGRRCAARPTGAPTRRPVEPPLRGGTTPGIRRGWQWERGTSGRWQPSPECLCWVSKHR